MADTDLKAKCSFCEGEYDERDLVDGVQEDVHICLKCAELAATILKTVQEMRPKE